MSTDPKSFNPFVCDEAHHMWDVAAELREIAPAVRLQNGFLFVGRYDAAREVLRDNQTFSAQGGFREDGRYVAMEDRNIGELDPPEHGPIRQLARSGAGGRRDADAMRPFVRSHAERLLKALLQRGGGDLIAELSLALTNVVIAKMLGVPLEDADQLAHWTEEMVTSNTVNTSRESAQQRAVAFPDFVAYIDGMIEARLSGVDAPQDAITRIVRSGMDEADLPVPIIRMILLNLLLGGTATTRDSIGHLLHELIVRPELHERLRGDPSLVPAAVEECLRLAPPVLFLLRRATQSGTLEGVPFEAGDRLLVALASANRDAEIFPDPDRFSLDRVDPLPHVSFGHGAHLCVGAALSRMEIQETLEVFLSEVRPGEMQLAPSFDLTYVSIPFLFGPDRVDVTYSPGGSVAH